MAFDDPLTQKFLTLNSPISSAGFPADEVDWRICPIAHSIDALTITDRENRLIAQGCRRWTCPICGPRRRHRFVLRIITAQPNRFVTLTCDRTREPAAQLAVMTEKLPRLVTKLRRDYGEVEYLRMLETCRDGYPHFHLLMRSAFIPHSRLRHLWSQATGATIVDIRKAHGRSISYVAKYIQKARNSDGLWSRQRVSVTKKFWPPERPESDLLITAHLRMHPQQAAAERSHLTYHRERIGRFTVALREPGDENPPELTPQP